MIRIGQGWDVHRLVEGRPLILGGVTVPHDKGLLGHSDADALLHAITDALLGPPGWAISAAIFRTPTRHFMAWTAGFCCGKPWPAWRGAAGKW